MRAYRGVSARVGRWITVACGLFLAVILLVLPTSDPSEGRTNHIAGFIALGLTVIALGWAIYREMYRTQFEWATQVAERHAQLAIKSGRAMPIPTTPYLAPDSELKETIRGVEAFAVEMISIPWGREKPPLPPAELHPQFEETVIFVRGVTGDWRQFANPIELFARMSPPWCYIGAAEIMLRLSYISGGVHVPNGLRQGLRFVAEAQNADPNNAEALIIRAKLLAGYPDKHWLRAAEDTLRRAQQLAPDHPWLPGAEAAVFRQFGEYEKALQANAESVRRATTPDERHIARVGRANLLLDLGRNEEAVAAFDEILREREDPWTWHNRSIALVRLGRKEDALASSDRALAMMEFSNARELNQALRKDLATQQAR